MKLHNPKRGRVLQAALLTSAPWGSWGARRGGGGGEGEEPGGHLGWNSAVLLPGCVRVLACDMVRPAQWRDRAAAEEHRVRLGSLLSAGA